MPAMWCKRCGETFTIKSNQAVVEELERFSGPATQVLRMGCKTAACVHYGLAETDIPTRYQQFGKTAAGSLRFRCRACRSTFAVAVRSTLRHRLQAKTALIYRLLINKSPMRRICEVADVAAPVVYQRIDFLHTQCMALAREHEALLKSLAIPRMGIAVDVQEHVVNWSSQADRRVTQLGATASADTRSGYILGVHLDYDPRFDAHDLDLAARECGDPERKAAFRRHARCFLPFEQEQGGADSLPADTRLPVHGVRVHSQYTKFAHFQFIKAMVPNVQRLHFYLDRDPGLHAGCFAAFGPDLLSGRTEAFLVKIEKSIMVEDKKRRLAASEQALAKARLEHPGLGRFQVARCMLAAQINHPAYQALPILQRWARHPLPNMGEPDKATCYLSDRGDLSPEQQAALMLDVQMHALDRFFMQVRRRLSVLERPIQSPSSRRRWHGYAVYNPSVVMRLLEIFRVTYNYVLVGADQKTPAMRLGLADQPVTLNEVIDFMPMPQSSTKA